MMTRFDDLHLLLMLVCTDTRGRHEKAWQNWVEDEAGFDDSKFQPKLIIKTNDSTLPIRRETIVNETFDIIKWEKELATDLCRTVAYNINYTITECAGQKIFDVPQNYSAGFFPFSRLLFHRAEYQLDNMLYNHLLLQAKNKVKPRTVDVNKGAFATPLTKKLRSSMEQATLVPGCNDAEAEISFTPNQNGKRNMRYPKDKHLNLKKKQ